MAWPPRINAGDHADSQLAVLATTMAVAIVVSAAAIAAAVSTSSFTAASRGKAAESLAAPAAASAGNHASAAPVTGRAVSARLPAATGWHANILAAARGNLNSSTTAAGRHLDAPLLCPSARGAAAEGRLTLAPIGVWAARAAKIATEGLSTALVSTISEGGAAALLELGRAARHAVRVARVELWASPSEELLTAV